VPFPIARHRQRVHRVHRVASGDHRAHEQTPIGLSGHDHLVGFGVGVGQQLVQPCNIVDAISQSGPNQSVPVGVFDVDVVVDLGPVVADERTSRALPPFRLRIRVEPEATSGELMDQCSSRRVIPPAIRGRPHHPAGARSRPRTHLPSGPAGRSADLPRARRRACPG